MFCDRCGAPAQPDQHFCSQCGKDFSGAMRQVAAGPNRVQEHIRFIGVLWLGLSVINAIAGGVLLILGNVLFPHIHEIQGTPPDIPAGFLSALFCWIGGVILVKAAAGFFAGWGLLQREPWARMLTMVLSFLALLNFPLGTALGVYSLWVLLPARSEREYEQEVARTAATV